MYKLLDEWILVLNMISN